MQLLEPPTTEELQRLYREEYPSVGHYYLSPDAHRRERWRVCQQIVMSLRALRSAGDPRVVAELGCGWGNLGLALTAGGLPFLGLDPSPTMCAHVRSLGLRALEGGLELLEEDPRLAREVQAVVMMAVFEHLPDQNDVLVRIRRLLPRDGILVIQTPTAGYPRVIGRLMTMCAPGRQLPSVFGALAPPWHICLPSPAGLRRQAERCGLRVVGIEPSRSGRVADPKRRGLQAVNEAVARLGHWIVGERWPLSMGHVFVLRPGEV